MQSTPELRNYSCYNFGNHPTSFIQLFSLEKKERINKVAQMNEIIFTTTGKSKIETPLYPDYTIDKENAIFLPAGSPYKLTSQDKSSFLIVCIEPFQNIPGSFFTTNPLDNSSIQTNCQNTGLINIRPVLKLYIEHLLTYIKDGFTAEDFFEIKITELILLLSNYYATNELVCFFKPILNPEISFIHLA